MLVADTNVILRLLLKDDPVQFPLALEACLRAQALGERIHMSQAVIQELFWVLENIKRLPRDLVMGMVDALLSADLWDIEHPRRLAHAMRYYEEYKVDFTDALLAAISHEKGMEGVLSFDADIGKMGVPWVKP